MNRLYLALCALFIHLSLLVSVPLQAQQVTFSEDFNSLKKEGDLADGWTRWDNGGGAYGKVWGAFRDHPHATNWYMYSEFEPGKGGGEKDIAWLMSPQITPQQDDYLVCDCHHNGKFDTDDTFEFRVSTTTNDHNAFTDVLAAYTWQDMPYKTGRVTLDLSAYVGIPIYIAIVHIADTGTDDLNVLSNYVIVDNFQVRNLMDAFVLDAVFRQATSPPQPPVLVTDRYIFVGSVGFIVAGESGVANVNSITLNTAGTTDMSLVKEVIVYYTPESFIDWFGVDNGDYPIFGRVENPGETITITGSQDLPLGFEPTLWFRFVLDETREISYPYPQIDVAATSFEINGVVQEPSVKTFFGAMDVVGPNVPNDHFADAIELSATPARYGSSTMMATEELEYDRPRAYCHNVDPLFVVWDTHTIWWYFVAPADGFVTADLSNSHFNTIVSFLDEKLNPVACNDDISAANQQSKIENYFIRQGEKIYVRVSDQGGSGANQWDASGVVIMDFSFSLVTGLPEDGDLSAMTLYPNPASQQVSLDITTQRATQLVIDVCDVMGRSRHTQQEQLTTAGQHTVPMDVSALPTGTYVVNIQDGQRRESRKLSIIK